MKRLLRGRPIGCEEAHLVYEYSRAPGGAVYMKVYATPWGNFVRVQWYDNFCIWAEVEQYEASREWCEEALWDLVASVQPQGAPMLKPERVDSPQPRRDGETRRRSQDARGGAGFASAAT